jgi:hypothetical protein
MMEEEIAKRIIGRLLTKKAFLCFIVSGVYFAIRGLAAGQRWLCAKTEPFGCFCEVDAQAFLSGGR